MPGFTAQAADLDRLGMIDRRRHLAPRRGVDFASNDYLALAADPRLAQAVVQALARGVAIGSGGSRLLRGNDAEHGALEEDAARFFGSEAALFFASGYAANVAVFATLPQRGDLVVHDALIHASAHEGMALGRARCVAAAHNDAAAFDSAIADWRRAGGTGRAWIAVESLYSMDGDRAPLAAIVEVAARHDAVLLIDEAHATGVFGARGEGLAAPWRDRVDCITLHTCGKALGCEGALVCAAAVACDFLVNRARGFIFSTAPSPLMAAAVRAALRIVADEPARRDTLQQRVAAAARVLAPLGVTATGSPILPLVLGDDATTMRVAAAVQARGYDVRGIRPPTVPAGTARLRFSITLNFGEDDLAGLADALAEALA